MSIRYACPISENTKSSSTPWQMDFESVDSVGGEAYKWGLNMQKAIYGLAMPFNDSSLYEDEHAIRRTNPQSVFFDGLVGATLEHDYLQEIGRTTHNLTLHLNHRGLFFKLIPNTPRARIAYKRVKYRDLRHCSISYRVKEETRNFELEQPFIPLADPVDHIHVFDLKKIVLFELCLTNQPRNNKTFCTTQSNHPLLRGIHWGTRQPWEIDEWRLHV